jgi:adenine-specific DNA-methyltransferase
MNKTTVGVKYIGSKQMLLDDILGLVKEKYSSPARIIDVFTGTTRVAQAFRQAGWTVVASDLSWASEAYAHAFLLRTAESGRRIPELIATLRDVTPVEGWLTNAYCETVAVADPAVRIQMWRRANGMKADAIRDRIAEWESSGYITHHEAMILVTALIVALDKVDSSVGVQQAYLKQFAARALGDLELCDLPYSKEGPPGQYIGGDALSIVYEAADVAYLDPPYSAHSYATYYHIWDSITRWDKPEVGLKTNRRIDRVSGSSDYDVSMVSQWNSKRTALYAFRTLLERLPVRHALISYNDESLIPLADLVTMIQSRWSVVEIHTIAYRRNIMCKIGNATAGAGAKTENNEVLIWIDLTSVVIPV